jgi:anaerobic selenocysteine-containing dehydrogenase
VCRTALGKYFDWQKLKQDGWQRLAVPQEVAAFAQGGFPTPSGKCELHSEWLEKQGIDPLPFFNPPAEVKDETLAERYPLAFISPPARHFLNSTFANIARFREFEKEPHLDMHPVDAQRRGIAEGDKVRVFNDRGSYELRARVNGKPRPGVVVAPSVWWKKHSPDGRNANDVTSQRAADLGNGATFYDCRVQVERIA